MTACVSRTHIHTHTHILLNSVHLKSTGNEFLVCVPATRAATADNTAQANLFHPVQKVSKCFQNFIVKLAVCSMAAENGLKPMQYTF